jgi:peptide-methionine (S)-S-oxide reductase
MRLSRRPSHSPPGIRPAGTPPADGSATTLAHWLLGPLLALVLLLAPAAAGLAATEEAVLAGGCFWCLEHDLEELPGVLDVESGYSGGRKANPTYGEVSAGGTGHQESVRVRFDNTKIRYEALLRAYWRNVDPFDGGGQFCDRGDSYRPVIFSTSATQAVEARNSLVAAARELGRPGAAIKVAVRPLAKFWPAETYHQNYARRNGLRYRYYRWSCRRDQRLDAVWGARARSGERWQAAQAPAPPATASGPGGTAAAPKATPAPAPPAAKAAAPLTSPAPQAPATAGGPSTAAQSAGGAKAPGGGRTSAAAAGA